MTHQEARAISVVDGRTGTLVTTIPVATRPCGIVVNGETNRVYVSDQEAGSVSVIDATTNRETRSRTVFPSSRPTGVLLSDLAVNPQNDGLYVVNRATGRVGILREASL